MLENYLNNLYAHLSPYRPPEQHPVAETHGEILYPSIEKLLAAQPLYSNDVFVDLGAGRGKVITHVFLTSLAKEVTGIEIVPALHEQAFTAIQKIREDFPRLFKNGRDLSCSQGSFFDVSFVNATVIFINATCFGPHLLHPLGKLVNNLPAVRLILTLRPLPHLTRFKFKKILRIEASWDTALCYIYVNNHLFNE